MKKMPDLKKLQHHLPSSNHVTNNTLWFWKQRKQKDIWCWTVMLQVVQLQLCTSVRRIPSISSRVAKTLAAERTAEFTSPSDMYHQIVACFHRSGEWCILPSSARGRSDARLAEVTWVVGKGRVVEYMSEGLPWPAWVRQFCAKPFNSPLPSFKRCTTDCYKKDLSRTLY